MPPHPALFLRRHVYDRYGLFDTGFDIAADYEFILRIFTQPGFKTVYVDRVFVKMRVGGVSNRSLGNIVRKSREDMRSIRRYRVGGLATLALKNVSKIGQFLGRG